MKTLFAAATALSLTGAAFGAQTQEPATTTHAQHAMHAAHDQTMTFDPNVILRPPASWHEPQLTMFREHMAYFPDSWTADERAMFHAQLEVPPAQWTPEQRLLYQQHFAALPPTWTPEQRAMYRQHMAHMTTPWLAHDMAMMNDGRTYAAVPATAKIVPPSNANPELDERGIPVISAAAVIPPGFNGLPEGAMGGPLADAATGDLIGEDEAYPACTATVTDNCIQLYEPGVRRSLADWNRPTGGFAGTTEAGMGGPYDPADEDARWNSHATQSSPTGTAPNDPVDTQGSSVVEDNSRGIDADGND